MMKFIKNIFNVEIYKNFILTLSGSTVAQILPILITPVLAVLYSPTELGVFGVFLAYTYILSKTLSLSYFQTIMLPRSDIKGMSLLWLSLIIAIISSIGVVIVLSLLSHFNYHLPVALSSNILALGLANFAFIANISIEVWLTRKKDYKLLSVSRMIRAGLVALLSVALYYLFKNSNGLVYSFVAGNLISMLYLLAKIFSKNSKLLYYNSMYVILGQGKRYLNYSIYNTPAYLVNNMTNYLPVFFIEKYFDPRIVGYYYLADRVIRSPLGLISDSFASVLYQHLSVIDKSRMIQEVNKYGKILAVIALVVIILFFFGGGFLFDLFFREEWSLAFPIMKVVILYGAMQMVSAIYCLPFKIAELNKQYMYWEILRFCIVLTPMLLLTSLPIIPYLGWYGVGLTASYLILIVFSQQFIRKKYGY